jgi:3-hydroxyisobutyrate dehydrogenase
LFLHPTFIERQKTMKAFIGMGLLGSNFVRAMLKKGEEVQVWNRTASKAKALEADGAKVFDNVADAVHGCDRIHITLKDDAVVNEVLGQASAGFEPDVIIIDHTTTSAEGAKERTEYWKQKGYTYIHAPVFMGPQNALESTGNMLVSGDPEIISLIEPELAKMTGKVMNFGTDTNKAAGMKLLGNLFLIAMTAGVADTLALAKALGISINEVSTLFDSWNPGAMMPMRLKKMTSNTFDKPSWELSMARKDAGLMMNAAQHANVKLMAIPSIAKEMDRWIEKGHGNDDWTVIGKDAVE